MARGFHRSTVSTLVAERFRDLWDTFKPKTFGDIVGAFTAIGLVFLWLQLKANTTTNQVAIRGQLYATEFQLSEEEGSEALGAVWALVDPSVEGQAYSRSLLELITTDSATIFARSPSELHAAMLGADAFRNRDRRSRTEAVRKTLLYATASLYHVHNAFDYQQEGIISEEEWKTWRGYIAEMNAHPILLTTIWNGHANRYFSREFGGFLQQALCGPAQSSMPGQDRNCRFARSFYPEMFTEAWLADLPSY